MKKSNRVWSLIGKKISKSISSEEEGELEQLLFESPELWYSYELIQAVISLEDVPEEFVREIKDLLDSHAPPEKLNHFLIEHTSYNHKPKSLKDKIKMPLLYISAVILAILISWGSITLLSNSNEQTKIQVAMNEIIAPKGSKTQLTLSDGTVIWLNAGSKLLYPKNYSLENRKVYLTGEAYFKVVHDSKHSFIVYTSEAEIRDLGTTFNVKAYLDGSTTETTLIEGSVEVMLRKNPDQKILMFPKEKLILHNQAYDQSLSSIVRENSGQIFEVSKIIPFSKTNDIVETAWLSDKLIFRNQRFEDLAKEMERKYNVNMIVKSDVVKDYTLTGIFRNENIEEALNLLQVIAPFKYKINESTIIIEN